MGRRGKAGLRTLALGTLLLAAIGCGSSGGVADTLDIGSGRTPVIGGPQETVHDIEDALTEVLATVVEIPFELLTGGDPSPFVGPDPNAPRNPEDRMALRRKQMGLPLAPEARVSERQGFRQAALRRSGQ